ERLDTKPEPCPSRRRANQHRHGLGKLLAHPRSACSLRRHETKRRRPRRRRRSAEVLHRAKERLHRENMIRDSITQVGILCLVIVAVVPCEAAGGQSDWPSASVQPPSTPSTSPSDKAGTIPAIRRVTNVMAPYPQVSRDDKILLFDSNRSGTSQIYRCTL